VLDGSGFVTVGETRVPATEGQEFFIRKNTKHRAEGGTENLRFLEISFGDFDENDIVRYEDKYNRDK